MEINDAIPTQKIDRKQAHLLLQQRLQQDATRDPVDALSDAESLFQILQCIHNVLHCPSTRYVLAQRICEDLVRNDLTTALSEAQQLLVIHRNRLDDMKEKALC